MDTCQLISKTHKRKEQSRINEKLCSLPKNAFHESLSGSQHVFEKQPFVLALGAALCDTTSQVTSTVSPRPP